MQIIIIKIFLFCLGAIVGSFLNVCIYRMPRKESVVRPGSRCPHCKHKISWYDNIPFISYILLGSRCRHCKKKISLRYFAVELITALVFIILFDHFGISLNYFIYTLFSCGLVVASFIDIEHRIIPDEISIGLLVAILIINFIRSVPYFSKFPNLPITHSLLGAIFGGGLVYVVAVIFNFILFTVIANIYKLFKKEFYLMKEFEGDEEGPSCMGGGDVTLMAMIGAFLGWRLALLTFFIAPFFGAVIGLWVLIRTKSHLIPYGPFLSLAAFTALLWGNSIIKWIVFLIGG